MVGESSTIRTCGVLASESDIGSISNPPGRKISKLFRKIDRPEFKAYHFWIDLVSDCLPARLRISAQIPTPVKQQVRRAPSSLSPSIHAFAELFGWPLDGSVNPRPRVLVNHEGVILRRLTRLEVILCQTICQSAERVGGADAHNFNLRGNCSLLGLAHIVKEGTPGAIPISNGRFGAPMLQHPLPGHQGTLGAYTLNTHGKWALDANLSKTFRLSESKALQLRVDARNVLNHPMPADPTGLTGGSEGSSFIDNFGQITSKSGSRTFQARLRLSF